MARNRDQARQQADRWQRLVDAKAKRERKQEERKQARVGESEAPKADAPERPNAARA